VINIQNPALRKQGFLPYNLVTEVFKQPVTGFFHGKSEKEKRESPPDI